MSTYTKRHYTTTGTTLTKDVYQRVTDTIVAQVEAGARPWVKPWDTVAASAGWDQPVRFNGQPYRGINVVLLWAQSAACGYKSNRWMTYNQAKALGAHVRKGEKGSLVVFTKTLVVGGSKPVDETTVTDGKRIFFYRGYTVFNCDQIDELPEKFTVSNVKPEGAPVTPDDLCSAAEEILTTWGSKITHGGPKAAYSAGADHVVLPKPETFNTRAAYYGTAFHELVHLTGHATRLNRDLSNRFGSSAYAFEELVAELGAAFLCAAVGVEPTVREDHAAYVANWLTVLKNDKRAIFTAASLAAKAADLIHPVTVEAEPEDEAEAE